MPRKGSRKVRTGCLTCKARKVKCDEAKPNCNRCTSTGRKCDGYKAPDNYGAASSSSGSGSGSGIIRARDTQLVWRRPRQLFLGAGASGAEGRALQFFCEISGPFLPGVTDPSFWTKLVMQFSTIEPAVRHSIVAISSLYEQSQTNSGEEIQIRDNELALRHYNAAIAELKTMENQSLVLLVCILFICIEFLQSNREAAIRHCKHGIYILRNNASGPPWVREHLVPLFRRLSIFPFFFGTGAEDFPSLVLLEDPVPEAFSDYVEARAMMDDIVSRTIRLVRCGDAYRFGGLRYVKPPPSLIREQEKIKYRLQRWRVLFANLNDSMSALSSSSSSSPNMSLNTPAMQQYDSEQVYLKSLMHAYLLISYETYHIWANTAFSAHETAYDQYLPNFRRLLQHFTVLETTLPDQSPLHKHYPKFIFEIGFMPITYFVMTKCRDLDVRLATLRLMRMFSLPQENLWKVDISYEVARRVVEIEHNVIINREEGVLLTPPAYPGLPPEEMRVRDTRTEHRELVMPMSMPTGGPDGTQTTIMVRGRIVNYFMRTPEDEIYVQSELFPVTMQNDDFVKFKGPRKTWTRDMEVRTPSPTSSPP